MVLILAGTVTVGGLQSLHTCSHLGVVWASIGRGLWQYEGGSCWEWAWVCVYLQGVCFWCKCEITHLSPWVYLQHLVLNLGTTYFLSLCLSSTGFWQTLLAVNPSVIPSILFCLQDHDVFALLWEASSREEWILPHTKKRSSVGLRESQ